MLRVTGLSLLLGAAALIVGLTLFFAPPHSSGQPVSAVALNPTTAEVGAGTPTLVDGELQIILNSTGTAAVNLTMEHVDASSYPFLHLALQDPSKDLKMLIIWTTGEDEQYSHVYRLESASRASLWIATDELPGWTGDLSSLSLMVLGREGDTVRIRDFSIHPTSASTQLRAIYSDLTLFARWNRAAMNTYSGTSKVSSFYPMALTLAFLFLSIMAYGLLILVSRSRLRFNWNIVALIFLASWIGLDMLWQNRLLQQLAETYRTFAGKTTEEKLAVGPDAQLFNFVAQIKPLMDARDSRIFVASSDLYKGMRVAYYLFPLNVLWSVHGIELPDDHFLRKGDLVALVNPSTFYFGPNKHVLIAPQRMDLPAELIFSNASGTLVRLN